MSNLGLAFIGVIAILCLCFTISLIQAIIEVEEEERDEIKRC